MLGVLSFGLAAAHCLQAAESSKSGVIDNFEFTDNSAAQTAWLPMAGSKPVRVGPIDGRNVLQLECNFAEGKTERASWDRKMSLDLASCRGVQFKVLCRDASPISYFSIYFQSGAGWYHAAFFPESPNTWNTVVINRSDMSVEGTPRGWEHIEAIRLSAWRSNDTNTSFSLSELRQVGVLGIDASVAIIRGDSAAQESPRQAGSIRRSAESLSRTLEHAGVSSVILSDLELSAARLQRASLLVLPRNPSMPQGGQESINQYVREGGKLLSLDRIPAGLASTLTGSTNCLLLTQLLLPEDSASQGRMFLTLAGYLAPDLWRQAAQARFNQIGMMSDFQSYDEAAKQIGLWASGPTLTKPSPGSRALVDPIDVRRSDETPLQSASVTAKLALAATLRESASQFASRERFPESIDKADAAVQRMTEAFCMAQPPLPGEFRAFWCHSAFGVQGIEWDLAIRRLADHGFTAILPNMLWGGAAFYPSDILPSASEASQHGDQIARCLDACRKYGIQMHVWKVNWNLGSAAPKQFVEKLRQENRLQASSKGQEEPWLCPSHPDNQKLEIESMVEIARRYPIDGLHFDYIRYPDSDHCFCAGCRDRFQVAMGTEVRGWPDDVLAGGLLREKWLAWRRGNITAVVKAVSEQARSVRPKIKLSAAVFPIWSSERNSIGQDWKLWCEQGYLDFVCPMDYTTSKANLENMIARQLEWAGGKPCFPGIGVSATSPRLRVDQAIDQILVTRRQRTGGFVIFNYGVPESEELLPMLGLGISRKK